MSKLRNFFNALAANDIQVGIKANGVSAQIDGSGIGGHVSADVLDRCYDSLKVKAAQKSISMTDSYTEQIESRVSEYERKLNG